MNCPTNFTRCHPTTHGSPHHKPHSQPVTSGSPLLT